MGIKGENILQIIDMHEKGAISTNPSTQPTNSRNTAVNPIKNIAQPKVVREPILSKKELYTSIQQNLIKKYTIDSEGNSEYITEILNELAALSKQYNDSDIELLYYFDEETFSFTWNQALLDNDVS